MARPYFRRSFLRQAPNSLLRQYLTLMGVSDGIAWGRLSEGAIDAIERAVETAPAHVGSRIDGDFRRINDLAEADGVQALIDEGQDPHHAGGVDLAPLAAEAPTGTHFAFEVFLSHPDVFRAAHDLHRADSVSLTRWHRRTDLLGYQANVTRAASRRLSQLLSRYYMRRDGRGQYCHVDCWKRGDRVLWFAHPQDYGQAPLGYDERHRLAPQPQRLAFDVVFQYCEPEGWLDLFVNGGRQTRQDLQGLFGEAILGVRLPRQEVEPVTYELDGLLDRHFPLPLEPADGVEVIRVRKLRLRVLGTPREAITLEMDSADDARAVYDRLDDFRENSSLSTQLLQLTKVGLQLVFSPNDRGRRRTLSFDVGHPNSCSLHEGNPLHDTAKKLLRRWGIDVSGRAQDGAAPRRYSYQRNLGL